ncbi:MAG: phosphate uptake regulator PhoU [Atopobiaceae bacterium]|jgi:phosphate transport system protein|nr:phosphate uptake regulator PhoU [Atopobiaceae bacterium]MCH4180480.1 phosphate uptake regulator PhoU [Atopobiaceae bacterium]MCH4214174.1 phosphate uptake regulator PhoU [Atopobiaceae bacterium]MCH4229481.1 phosphate uptake regulator PhoU [Atopobiaceae bacterium]MCH4275840.1 phosphate uptake regulator PhoU [Atopobiaceae bacterium]
MREQFNRQLSALRQELVSILADVDLEIHGSVDALIQDDKALAKRTKKATKGIDARCADLEDQAYNLIVLQQPVASDLRLLQFIIYSDFNLARMSKHAREIAKTVKRCHGHEVPGQLLDLLASEAHLVYRVLGTTAEAIVESDLGLAASLPALAAPVETIYKQFFRSFVQLPQDTDRDAVMRIMVVARLLERICDNSLEIGSRLVFLLTGRRQALVDLAALSEDQLKALYVARGEGLSFDIDTDADLARQIPEVSITSLHPGRPSRVLRVEEPQPPAVPAEAGDAAAAVPPPDEAATKGTAHIVESKDEGAVSDGGAE